MQKEYKLGDFKAISNFNYTRIILPESSTKSYVINIMDSKNMADEIDKDILNNIVNDARREAARGEIILSQMPSTELQLMDRATALSRKNLDGISTQKLHDVMLARGCSGCGTLGRCLWLKQGMVTMFDVCPCKECLIKSMCNIACPDLKIIAREGISVRKK